jgi:hypothetical protein
LRKLRSEFRHRYQLNNDIRIDADATKLIFDVLTEVQSSRSILNGFVQEIKSNPFGCLLISDIQVI